MTDISILSNLLKDYKLSSANAATNAGQGTTTINDVVSQGDAYGPAYLVDISQAAQDILNTQQNQGSQGNINLSNVQKQAIKDILEKYKDAPVNEQTLQALGADLHKAGVAPEQLASIQKAKDFNPVEIFLQILDDNNGTSNSGDSIFGLTDTASDNDNSSNGQLSELLQQYLASTAPQA